MEDTIASNLKSLEDFQNFLKLYPHSYRQSVIYGFLNQFTWQKSVQILFDLGLNTSALQLFEQIPGIGQIKKYIKYKYRKQILRGIISLKEWKKLQFSLGNQETFLKTFNFIKTLPKDEKKEVERNLDVRENLLAKILLESEGTNLDEWTDEIIQERIRTTNSQNEFIINEFTERLQVPFVKWMIYYIYDRAQLKRIILNHALSSNLTIHFQKEVEGWSENSEFPSLENPLLTYRGDAQGFEELLLENMIEQYQSEIGGHMSVNWMQDYLDQTGSQFGFPSEFPYVLYQYPGSVGYYLRYLSFRDSPAFNIDQIIDLFDRKDELQPIRDYANTFNNPKGFILEEFGVII